MYQKLKLPEGMVGRFAVVKLWPDIKAAEDEVISRIKLTASNLGIECIEIHEDGRLIADPKQTITRQDVDFVIHLHFDTPKQYDAFSLVALWNPIDFYFEWGYQRTSNNLLSHDDFLSCSSVAADDQIKRMTNGDATHLEPFFTMYHSVCDIMHEPSLGDCKLFYAGINWEALGKKGGRHQELLKILDKTGKISIYGPEIFQGVRVWEGYKSYVKEIPFDGVSMLDEISKTGIALALSSDAHKSSELMSNRLFESIAAGAVIICDENKFAKKYFGDCLLYIDSRNSPEKVAQEILDHVEWIRTHQDDALKMIAEAQRLFREKYSLLRSLTSLYEGLEARKAALRTQLLPEGKKHLSLALCFLMPEYDAGVLATHITSSQVQDYDACRSILAIDRNTTAENRQEIEKALAGRKAGFKIVEVEYFGQYTSTGPSRPRLLGAVLNELLDEVRADDSVIFIAPNERMFSNHAAILASSLIRNPEINCAGTTMILKNEAKVINRVHNTMEFWNGGSETPNGLGRFIFRTAGFGPRISSALRYMNHKLVLLLAGDSEIIQEIPSTLVLDVDGKFPLNQSKDEKEQQVLLDYFGKSFKNLVSGNAGSAAVGAVAPAPALGRSDDFRCLADGLMAFLNTSQEVSRNTWIKIAPDSIGAALAYRGWHPQERWGKWGNGGEQALIIPNIAGNTGDIEVRVRLTVLLNEKFPTQDVEIYVKSDMVGSWHFRYGDNNEERKFIIPVQLVAPSSYTEVIFKVKEPRSPQTVGLNSDIRVLGLGIKAFKVNSSSVKWNKAARFGMLEYPAAIENEIQTFGSVKENEWIGTGRNSPLSRLLFMGWGDAEDWGRWGLGASHTLLLPLNTGVYKYWSIYLTARTMNTKNFPKQVVTVYVNNALIATLTFTKHEKWEEKKITIPQELLNETKLTEIEFRVAEPRSPKSIGVYPDSRLLGMALRRIKLSGHAK
jgi:hypothetical protein